MCSLSVVEHSVWSSERTLLDSTLLCRHLPLKSSWRSKASVRLMCGKFTPKRCWVRRFYRKGAKAWPCLCKPMTSSICRQHWSRSKTSTHILSRRSTCKISVSSRSRRWLKPFSQQSKSSHSCSESLIRGTRRRPYLSAIFMATSKHRTSSSKMPGRTPTTSLSWFSLIGHRSRAQRMMPFQLPTWFTNW